MLDELYTHQQCQTCKVIFQTNAELHAHLEAYKTYEQVLSAKSEECRAHRALPREIEIFCTTDGPPDQAPRADPLVTDSSDVYNTAVVNAKRGSARQCPYDHCRKEFSSRRQLIAHFEQHWPCNEVCVYCFKRFSHASAYIKHVKAHPNVDERKNRFLVSMCDYLRDQARSELDRRLVSLSRSSEITPSKRILDDEESEPKVVHIPKKVRQQSVQSEAISAMQVGYDGPSAKHLSPPAMPPSDVNEVDVFAPPLFVDECLASVEDFDAPLFGPFSLASIGVPEGGPA